MSPFGLPECTLERTPVHSSSSVLHIWLHACLLPSSASPSLRFFSLVHLCLLSLHSLSRRRLPSLVVFMNTSTAPVGVFSPISCRVVVANLFRVLLLVAIIICHCLRQVWHVNNMWCMSIHASEPHSQHRSLSLLSICLRYVSVTVSPDLSW